MTIDVIIPALNEASSIGLVVRSIDKELVRRVVVVDNGSEDDTVRIATDAGAIVLLQPLRGYGSACLMGIDFLKADPPDVVVFLDGDYSDYPEELVHLIAPIARQEAVFVLGARVRELREPGSMTPQQVFGNGLATMLIRILFKRRYLDLGPFRAITWAGLLSLNMKDKNYGWTVEMQVKAARKKLATIEIPVRYRKRIGYSKVSGTIKGTVLAGYKIIATIFRYGWMR
ncbi:MAG: glycosyltransferase [Flavobacteriales bacterium]|nr:glycosyltransferase [Flavobacteriales bacterium]